MLTHGLLFLAGLALLYGGAEGLVAGASRLARRLGISALVVGLTVVSFGTSAPELVVTLLAAARGTPDLAVGNVVGSNIANIGLILAITAVISPLQVRARLIRREIPLVIATSVAFLLLIPDGAIGRTDGFFLLLGLAGYILYVLRAAPRTLAEERAALLPREPEGLPAALLERIPAALVFLLGLGALVGGANLLVEASVWFAERAGLSDLVIGLTLVAAGTSLPELATSAVAALRGETDIAVGNVLGSNLFNLLGVLGLAAMIYPLPAPAELLRFQGPVMVGSAILLLPLAWTRFRLQRWEGALLLVGYVAFVWALLAGIGPA